MGGGGLERIIEKRRALRDRAIEVAREFAECASSKLGEVVAVLHGSYARGDFGEWSDVDVLVVVKGPLPKSPLKRLDLVEECLARAPGSSRDNNIRRIQGFAEKERPACGGGPQRRSPVDGRLRRPLAERGLVEQTSAILWNNSAKWKW